MDGELARMSEAKARELLAALVEAWDSGILAGRFLRLNDAFHAARAYLAAVPAPPAEPCKHLRRSGEIGVGGFNGLQCDDCGADLLAAPAAEPVAQPRERNWRWCTSRGYENGERCDDATDCTKNGCAKGRMLLAGVCPDCNGKGCAACYAP